VIAETAQCRSRDALHGIYSSSQHKAPATLPDKRHEILRDSSIAAEQFLLTIIAVAVRSGELSRSRPISS